MPHIHTNPGEHDLTSSGVILRMQDDGEYHVLLHMHKKLGKYMQFGGHVELGQHLWAGVIDEVRQESGYVISQLGLLQPVMRIRALGDAVLHPIPLCINTHENTSNHYHMDLTYGFIVDDDPAVTPQHGESQDMRYFTEQELDVIETESNVISVCKFALEAVRDSRFEVVSASDFSISSTI